MVSVLMLFGLILIYTMQSFLCKVYSDNYPGDQSMTSPIFSIVSGVIAAAATLAVTGFAFRPQPATLLLGLLNAVVLAGYNICFIGASSLGDYSVLMTFLIAGGITIPTLAGVIGFGDRPGVMKYIAIVIVIAAAYLIAVKQDPSGEKGDPAKKKKFLIFCLFLAVFNGAYGMLLDFQQRISGPDDKEEMIIITYFVMALGMLVYSLIRRGGRIVSDFRQTKKSAVYLVVCSLVVALAINVLAFMLKYIGDSTMVFTFDNAGTHFFSVICSVVFFKEKLSVRNIIGVVLMCAGLIMTAVF